MTSDHLPEISIVIRAFNEERWLPEVLASLNRQTCRDFEVLLVDSGSTDRTREIAAANGVRVVRLRSEDFTFGHSLNVGIQESRGSLVAILSAHAIPADEGWLERLVAPLRQPGVALVYGGQRGHEISKFSEARDFERICSRLTAPKWIRSTRSRTTPTRRSGRPCGTSIPSTKGFPVSKTSSGRSTG